MVLARNCLPVAAAVEPVADLLAGSGIDWAGAGQRGEAGLAAGPGLGCRPS
jgi:hypothetical protein